MKEAASKAARESELATFCDLECLLHEAVAAKNRYFHREGCSPFQLEFGENHRLPQALLSDDAVGEVVVEALGSAVADRDTAAAAFARKRRLREAAVRAPMEKGGQVPSE